MSKVIVGIIGNKGKYGVFLTDLFTKYGCNVIGSDVQDGSGVESRNRTVVETAQVVVFAVPPRAVVSVIEPLTQYSRPEQLWVDITSIKKPAVSAMMKSEAEVLGLHPMCAPTTSLRGQTVVVCPARLNEWHRWAEGFVAWTGAIVHVCKPEEHDRAVAVVQGLVHAMQLTMASTLRALNQAVGESLKFTSPVYRIALSLVGRILKQDPNLYADIQMLNPEVVPVLRQAAVELEKLISLVSMGARDEFVDEFLKSREHFGQRELADAFDLFDELNQLLADRSGQYKVLVRVNADRPGLLAEIANVFAQAGVNMTSIHSFRIQGWPRFAIGIDRPRTDAVVQQVIRRLLDEKLIDTTVV